MNESVQKSRQTLLKSIALGLLLALAVTLRVQQIQSLSFWFDEACSWKISQLSWTETLDAVSRDAHPPLYYFLCKAWSSVFGTSVLAARSLSILFGIATILACLWFSREADIDRMNPRPNQERVRYSMSMLAVAMLVGLNAFQIELSQEARPYTLGAFLSVVSACFLLRAVRAKFSLADWSGFTIAVILLSFTHYYCLFTIGALYLFLGLEILLQWKTSRVEGIRLLKYSLVSAWFVQLAWLPWWSTFFNQLSRANRQLWMKPFAWDEFAKVCADSLGISETSGQSLVASYIAIGIWGVLSLAFLFSRERSHRLAGMCALAPLIMAMIYSISTRSIIGDRYLLFAQTFFLINLALLLRPYRYQRLATILVMGVFIWLMSWIFTM